MRVAIIGINHKLADLKLREILATTCQRRFGSGNSMHSHHSFVLLSTCNRTEIYFSSEDLLTTHAYLLNILRQEIGEGLDQKFYSYFGYDCFLHLSKVASGLDSAIIAETEIQGQVKAAYEIAIKYSPLPPEMHYLFQKSLMIGKKIRSKFPVQPGTPDLQHAIYQTGISHLKQEQDPKVLFVGASEINLKILAFLQTKNLRNLTLCNRSITYSKSIAESHNLQLMYWEELSKWHFFDWIIVGTKAPHFVISNSIENQRIGHKLIFDLSVPRNVDPSIEKAPWATLYNIDQINKTLKVRRKKIEDTLSSAERLVEASTKQHLSLFLEKKRHPCQLLVHTA